MRDRPSHSRSLTVTLETASRWAPRIILLSLVVIIVSTLYPFKFSLSEPSPLLMSRTSKLDVIANIVLFMPLGFGLASALAKRKFSPSVKLLLVLVLGGCLSLSVEILQTFLSGRDSAFWDVLTNTTGAAVGHGLFQSGGKSFYQWVPPLLSGLQLQLTRLKLPYLIAGIVGYGILAAILVLSWQTLSLQSWDLDQPLSMGSNITIQMPEFLVSPEGHAQTVAWNGTISNLVISDRAFSQDEVAQEMVAPNLRVPTSSPGHASVLALYPLNNNQALHDRTGQSPDLAWQGTPPTSTRDRVTLSAKHWLTTATPVTQINQRIRDSAQFTLSATLAAAQNDSSLTHLPILTIGSAARGTLHLDHFLANRSNVGLAQSGRELLVWLRISRTGWDQSLYTAHIPDFFRDSTPHRVFITYSGFLVRVYVDGVTWSLTFDATPNRYQIVLYVLVLMPFALLLSLVANRLQQRLAYIALVAGSALLPPLVLESLLVREANRPFRAANLLLGFLIMGGTILAFQGDALRSERTQERTP